MDTLRRKEDDIFFGSCLRLFEEEILCDVTLVVGDQKEKIRAHKFILIARSEVFCAMLSGNYSETNGEIRIPDIEPDIFKILIRYMYTSHLMEPTQQNIFSLLYAGEKYQLGSLVDRCEIYLKKKVSTSNYFTILNHATLYNKKELLKECQLYAAGWGNQITDSEHFLSLTSESLLAFVNSDYSNVNEAKVFKACINWAKNQCEKKRKKVTPKNIRQSLGAIFHLIRFTAMDIQTFTAEVSKENILTDGEKVALFQSIVNKSEEYKGFNFTSASQRRPTTSFNNLSNRAGNSVHDDKKHQESILIKFDKDVHLVEMYLFGPDGENQKCDGNIKITIKESDSGILQHVCSTSTSNVGTLDNDTVFVPIKSFARLTANTQYVMMIELEGDNFLWKRGLGKDCRFVRGDLTMNVQKLANGIRVQSFKNVLTAFYGLAVIKD